MYCIKKCGTIFESVESGDQNCITVKLNEGDDIDELFCTNQTDCAQNSQTALYRSVLLKKLPMVEFLVNNNADLEVMSPNQGMARTVLAVGVACGFKS